MCLDGCPGRLIALPISQRAPAKNGPNSLLVNVDIPIDTKRLARISFYPSKIDLVIGDFPHFLWVFPWFCDGFYPSKISFYPSKIDLDSIKLVQWLFSPTNVEDKCHIGQIVIWPMWITNGLIRFIWVMNSFGYNVGPRSIAKLVNNSNNYGLWYL